MIQFSSVLRGGSALRGTLTAPHNLSFHLEKDVEEAVWESQVIKKRNNLAPNPSIKIKIEKTEFG